MTERVIILSALAIVAVVYFFATVKCRRAKDEKEAEKFSNIRKVAAALVIVIAIAALIFDR